MAVSNNNGPYQHSAALPYLLDQDVLKVVLITSRKRRRWIIPKGAIEPDLTAWDSAAKEAWEEAGIEGVIATEPLGVYEHQKWGSSCAVQVFPLAVTQLHHQWLEDHERQRRVVSLTEAYKLIEMKSLQKMLRQLEDWLHPDPHL